MRTWLGAFLDATPAAVQVESRFECSWCGRTFEDRATDCPACRGVVVRVVVE